MKFLKKAMAVLITFSFIFSIFNIPIWVNAKETSENIPMYVSYQAKRYSDSFTMYLDNSASYARRYYNIMKEKESVISGIAVWESAHIATDLSYAMDTGLISKRDMYQIAIFDMLGVSDSNEYIDKAFESMNSSRFWGRMSITKSLLKSETIRSDDLKTLPISSEIIDFIKNDSDTIDEFFEEADMVKSVVDVGKTIYEAIDTIASYHAMCEMRDGTVDILNAIATDSENPWDLRLAASECVKHFNVGYEKALNSILNSEQVLSDAIIRKSVEILFEEAWGALIKAIPGATFVMAFAKGYRVLSNEIFKMDDTCKTYYQFCAAVELEEAVHRVMENMKNDFRENYDIQKASLYMRSVELYENIVLKGYDYTIDMLEIKATAPVTKWADWLDHEYGECMELIEGAETAKSNKRSIYKQYEDWIKNDYKNKYYSNYDSIADAVNDQTTTYANSVSFTQTREIYEGDSGYIFDYIQKTYQPENSVEYQKCYFTADNKDVFTIDQYGAFVAESTGQVKLTYDKGGNLESSITITVHNKDEIETHNFYNDFEYSIYNGKAIINKYKGTASRVIIPSTLHGYPVRSINDEAFAGFTGLNSVVIPDSVTSIGKSAFRDCTGLNSVVIPDSVTSVGGYAFYDCIGLTSAVIGNSVTSIDWCTFYDCTALTSVIIPDSVTSVGGYAFYDCIGLTSAVIGNSVTSIDRCAFYGCKELTSITIPDSVTSIGYEAFDGCNSLTHVVIPDSVTSIGDNAFGGCTALTSVNIPDSVTSIGWCTFYDCTALTSVVIPDSVTSIGDLAFCGCTALTSIVIPDSVTSIGNLAFCGCTALTSIVIPDSVTSIGYRAFEDCMELASIAIPDSVMSIGYEVFNGCKSLTKVDIPSSGTSIGYGAFRCCTGLTSITIPEGVTSIVDMAFDGCASLTSITIPDSVTSIGSSAFSNCASLVNITIPDGVTSIRSSAFSNCTSLVNITIPDNVTSIGRSAFYGCSNLESITIPKSVTSIDEYAFLGCYNLSIFGHIDSEAEEYAKKNQIIFVALDEATPDEANPNTNKLFGDSNSDGVVDILDATVVQKYSADKITLNNEQKETIDVNNDGVVDILDATMIQKFAVDKITEFKKKV